VLVLFVVVALAAVLAQKLYGRLAGLA
jgi:hypothetical protein